MARACGSYPQCPRFDSRCRHHIITQTKPIKHKKPFISEFFCYYYSENNRIKPPKAYIQPYKRPYNTNTVPILCTVSMKGVMNDADRVTSEECKAAQQ